MKKEWHPSNSGPFGIININEAHLGPVVLVSEIASKEKPLDEALKPHVHDGSVPARLVNRLKDLANIKPAENL